MSAVLITWILSLVLVSKCENFDPYFSMEYDSMILKRHFISLHCEGSQKCIFNAFNATAILLYDRFLTEQQRQ